MKTYSAGRYRMQYDGSEAELSAVTATVNYQPGLAIQSEKDSADINTLVRRFKVTGDLPVSQRSMFYGDFSEVGDFQSALDQTNAAREAFMELPSDIRERFANDPGRLMKFIADPDNKAEAVKLGIMRAPPEPPKKAEPIEVRVVANSPPLTPSE